MDKKVIDLNRLPKQEYTKPAMEIYEASIEEQILAGSLTNYSIDGLEEEVAGLIDDQEAAELWDNAW